MNEPLDILDILNKIRANKISEVELVLKLKRIGASQVNRLFELLKKTQSVKELNLSCNSIEESEEQIKKLCEVIENNKSITTIKLYGNTFTTHQLELLAKALIKNLTVTIFTYSDENDDAYTQSEAIQIIRLCLERNQNIATLNSYTPNNLSEVKDSEHTLLKKNGHILFKSAVSNNYKNAFHVGGIEEEPIDVEVLKDRNQFIEQALERYYLPELEKNNASRFTRQ